MQSQWSKWKIASQHPIWSVVLGYARCYELVWIKVLWNRKGQMLIMLISLDLKSFEALMNPPDVPHGKDVQKIWSAFGILFMSDWTNKIIQNTEWNLHRYIILRAIASLHRLIRALQIWNCITTSAAHCVHLPAEIFWVLQTGLKATFTILSHFIFSSL